MNNSTIACRAGVSCQDWSVSPHPLAGTEIKPRAAHHWCLSPAGRFRMGSTDFYPKRRRCTRSDGFAVDRGPVTLTQFARSGLRYRPAARQPQAIDTSTSHIGFRCVTRDNS